MDKGANERGTWWIKVHQQRKSTPEEDIYTAIIGGDSRSDRSVDILAFHTARLALDLNPSFFILHLRDRSFVSSFHPYAVPSVIPSVRRKHTILYNSTYIILLVRSFMKCSSRA